MVLFISGRAREEQVKRVTAQGMVVPDGCTSSSYERKPLKIKLEQNSSTAVLRRRTRGVVGPWGSVRISRDETVISLE